MKKVSLKKEVSNIMDNLEELERPAMYKECPKEYQYNTNGFKCNVDTSVMNLDDMKKLIASNVNRLNRALTTPRSVIERRSNKFQEALVYISEHRHLIPFFRFLYDWTHEHPDKSVQDGIREYRKKFKQLPAELVKESGYCRGTYFHLGTKQPELATVIAQIAVLPKAWLL